MEEPSAGFVVYRMERGAPVYLLLRNAGDTYWGFPKGKTDPGETDEEAATRELAEETGITSFETAGGFESVIEYWYTRAGNRIHKTVRYFLARTRMADIEISTEHSEYGWFGAQEAGDRITFANLKEILEQADRFVRKL
jgi:8-oxo-dGTP pyrophosphatase MutT (NUDIX family)